MKKAKLILSALAVFALIGGALAFKATRAESDKLFITQGQVNYTFTTAVGGPVYTTTVQGCVTTGRWLFEGGTGPIVNTYTSSINPTIVTGFNGANSTTTAYPICTLILQTRTTAVQP